jgi:hypothetical protein
MTEPLIFDRDRTFSNEISPLETDRKKGKKNLFNKRGTGKLS